MSATYLLDADLCIDALSRPGGTSAGFLQRFASGGFAISVLTHGEVLDGLLGANNVPRASRAWEVIAGSFEVLHVTRPIAELWAQVRRDLRRSGQKTPDIDLLIGCTAVIHGLALVTRNRRHFERIPGLAVAILQRT